jgi:endonuclease/exonuclease/phosphatase family metal-dependent hydrolase
MHKCCLVPNKNVTVENHEVFLIVFASFAVWLIFIFIVNRSHRPSYKELKFKRQLRAPFSPGEVTVVCWNIGYGALGSQAECVLEGGKVWRAYTKKEIRQAAQLIANDLYSLDPDVALIQEAARSSFFTRGVNILEIMSSILNKYSYIFCPDVYTVFVPRPLKIQHGLVTYVQNDVTDYNVCELPQESSYYYGFQKKHYTALVVRQQIVDRAQEWVFVNIHLSAFDKDQSLRRLQLETIFNFAKHELQKGNFVVIGGDWNMKIAPTMFPCKYFPNNQFWAGDFPMESLPEDWKFAVDLTIPTARSQERPYVKGESFTTIIDGFVTSPNVSVLEVKAINKDFLYTDHHPVLARFRANT